MPLLLYPRLPHCITVPLPPIQYVYPNPTPTLPKLISLGHEGILTLDTQTTSRTKAFDALKTYTPSKRLQGKALVEESNQQLQSSELERLQTRRWKKGDIYSPHDLSPAEMKKWRERTKPDRDVFDMLNINPLDEYKVALSLQLAGSGRLTRRSRTIR
jgi:hypothetical protein